MVLNMSFWKTLYHLRPTFRLTKLDIVAKRSTEVDKKCILVDAITNKYLKAARVKEFVKD